MQQLSPTSHNTAAASAAEAAAKRVRPSSDKLSQLPRSRQLEAARAEVAGLLAELEKSRVECQGHYHRLMARDAGQLDGPAKVAEALHEALTAKHKAAAARLAEARREHAVRVFAHVAENMSEAKVALLARAQALEVEASRIVAIADEVERDTGARSHRLFGAARRIKAACAQLRVSLK